jgi:hypothetical protein
MKRIPTKYPHIYNADGSKRYQRCSGSLDIVCDPTGVYVCCNQCGEGYRFQFVMRRSDELMKGSEGPLY